MELTAAVRGRVHAPASRFNSGQFHQPSRADDLLQHRRSGEAGAPFLGVRSNMRQLSWRARQSLGASWFDPDLPHHK